jgi:hypothetical protein
LRTSILPAAQKRKRQMHADAAWHQPAWPHSTSRHTRESGYPVRRGPSVNHRHLWNTGSSAFADDDSII